MPAMKTDPVSRFLGLNNVGDSPTLGLQWLREAVNVNVTAAGKLERRDGYSLFRAAEIPAGGAFTTSDFQRGYYVDAGDLTAFDGTTLRSGLAMAPMSWAEVNGQVFFCNGIDSGIIAADGSVLDWAWPVPGAPTLAAVTGTLAPGTYQVRCTYTLADGRETGPGDTVDITLVEGQALQVSGLPQLAGARTNVYIAPADSPVFSFADAPQGTAMVWNTTPDNLGMDMLTFDADPLPPGHLIAFWRGRVYVAMHDVANDQTVVWFSQALGFHLFNTSADFLLLPGLVHMLAPHALGLVIGTDRAIHAYDGGNLAELAPYGVPPGQHWDTDGDTRRLLFWSKRGLCTALPFSNLTEGHLSVAPGTNAGGAVLQSDGARRYVVVLQQGGTAFNPRNPGTSP